MSTTRSNGNRSRRATSTMLTRRSGARNVGPFVEISSNRKDEGRSDDVRRERARGSDRTKRNRRTIPEMKVDVARGLKGRRGACVPCFVACFR